MDRNIDQQRGAQLATYLADLLDPVAFTSFMPDPSKVGAEPILNHWLLDAFKTKVLSHSHWNKIRRDLRKLHNGAPSEDKSSCHI